MSEILWQPSAERAAGTQIIQFARTCGFDGPHAVERLWQWSVDRPADFWEAVWETCNVAAEHAANVVLENPDAMPGARWFVDARLNYAENLLRRSDDVSALSCPDCGEQHLSQQYSTFAAHASGPSSAASEMPSCPSGMCGNPGMCGRN